MLEGNICIGGFMCAGKTSVGRELSRRLGWEFLDCDTLIEERAGMPVPRIFAELGEPAFRRFEFDVVSEALEGRRRVISLGGGALANEELRNRVLWKTCLVILDVRAETVLCRAEQQKGTRPLLDSGTVNSLMAKRRPVYASCHLRVATDEYPVTAVADRILADIPNIVTPLLI
jgi:shikimate kinase